ncbi:MAG: hypothetical protein BGO70_03690 [Bacteroidetes bacterium 43-93]|uniref:hypothetical protein n=1 Tax=uncultured Dysgonomonas sp. TaxID=206096 RepID=UPI00092B621A|nr:hypothetical protein [uncultured Dysgonomonas sp.]MBN9485534.1 hypothetical protein [Bacteroidota bacterium]OJW99072.1 MAG: hypothetical protein BGO70_03690 [Bacteroidetes bacterium 43-93]
MKYYLVYVVTIATLILSSCKQTAEKLDNYDMSEFCKKYYILKSPSNKSLYVFIKKKSLKERFLVWKDYNYKESGFGYVYGYKLDLSDAVKNGVFNSASEAIEKADEHIPTDGTILFLYNLIPLGHGQWVTNGELLSELCYERKPANVESTVKPIPAQDERQNFIGNNKDTDLLATEKTQQQIMADMTSPQTIDAPTDKIDSEFQGSWRTSADDNSYISTTFSIGEEKSSWSPGNALELDFKNHVSGDTLILVYDYKDVSGAGWTREIEYPEPNTIYAKCYLTGSKTMHIEYQNKRCLNSFKVTYNDRQLNEVFGSTLYKN